MNDASGSPTVTAEDLAYHHPPTGPLLARLYQPHAPGPFPAVVSVHGGRWTAETRLTNAVIDHALAAAGIVVMAIDFRMPPEGRYPVPVADINLAIRWLKVHASRLGIDARAIGAVGTSSGGHQVMLNAMRPRDPRYAAETQPGLGDVGAELAFVVTCWPVLDPLARYAMAKERNMDLHVRSHHAYWPDEAAMAEGNPQLILERGEAIAMPPVLLVQGTADVILTPDMADRFAAAYRAKGGDITLRKYEGQGHTFITKLPEEPASKTAIKAIEDFILRQADRLRRQC